MFICVTRLYRLLMKLFLWVTINQLSCVCLLSLKIIFVHPFQKRSRELPVFHLHALNTGERLRIKIGKVLFSFMNTCFIRPEQRNSESRKNSTKERTMRVGEREKMFARKIRNIKFPVVRIILCF